MPQPHRITSEEYRSLKRLILILFVITMATVVVIGWGEDKRSCQRQVIPRQQAAALQNVTYDFLISAAEAREGSAKLEGGAQKVNDLATATKYRNDAARLHTVPDPGCGKLIAPDH